MTSNREISDGAGVSATRVLKIDASGRRSGSVTRELTGELVSALEDRFGRLEVTERDLASGLPFVSEAWIAANFTPEEERSPQQESALAGSDALVDELRSADLVVIGVPIYNFGVPAALKAWIDMVARARKTFRYTDKGPEGLLRGKTAYLVVASGGVPVGSALDFATPYMRHALGFLGIEDVKVIAAEKLNTQNKRSLDAARTQIIELVHGRSADKSRAA